MLVARENSRRSNNNLLKPLSDIDMNQFSKQDRVTPKYYRLPQDFPLPVCSGRYQDPNTSTTLNDHYCSITSGSEYKFKTRYEYEENLFKNEDSMY
jgi:histone deacetylase complex regulatory component SIN3